MSTSKHHHSPFKAYRKYLQSNLQLPTVAVISNHAEKLIGKQEFMFLKINLKSQKQE